MHKNKTEIQEPANLRKRAEVALQEKVAEKLQIDEHRFRSFVEHSLDIIVIMTLEGLITYINPAVERALGFKVEERIGARGIELVHPDDRKPLIDKFNTLGRDTNAPVVRFEMRLRHKDGSWRTFEAVGSNLVHNNVVEAVIVNYHDITKRKQDEEKLRGEEQRFRALAEQSSDIIVFVNREGIVTYENPAVERSLGLKAEERIGVSLFDRIHPDDLKFAMDAFNKFTFDKQSKDINAPVRQIRLRHQDGSWRTFEAVGSKLVRDNFVEFVIVNLRDITERKQAEAKLRQQIDAMDAAIDGMAILNAEEEYVYLNKAHANIYGYENVVELIGKSWRLLYDSDVLQRFDQEIMPEFSRKGDWYGEAIGTKKNGSKFPQELSLTAMADGGLICVVRDITDRKQVEEELQLTLESLRKAVGTTIQVLVSAVESRDPYTAGHQIRSADLARAIAAEIGLPQEKVDGIRMAGSIHDIGKLSVPTEILSKPSKLTDLEFSLIKEHPRKGSDMLKDVESPWPLAQIVYQHHERMDGSGYPNNLKGDEILMDARIMAVADVVEAMASHRPYRAALGIETALEEIEKNKGILYDDAVVDACLRLFREKGYRLL